MTPLAIILVVDSDTATRNMMSHKLRELGHRVSERSDASSALAAARQTCPDLMVCDCSLPDLAGVELLSDVRCNDDLKGMRVLMTSDREETSDVVIALESGADDFVAKPINIPEFVARIDACLRRPANVHRSRAISAGGITMDVVGHRVSADGHSISLAPREYSLLLFLLSNQDRVFSRSQLLAHVWDRDAAVGVRTIDVHIRRLRSLLEPSGYDEYVQTVRGSGYRFSLLV